jgi:hypothetical protein
MVAGDKQPSAGAFGPNVGAVDCRNIERHAIVGNCFLVDLNAQASRVAQRKPTVLDGQIKG